MNFSTLASIVTHGKRIKPTENEARKRQLIHTFYACIKPARTNLVKWLKKHETINEYTDNTENAENTAEHERAIVQAANSIKSASFSNKQNEDHADSPDSHRVYLQRVSPVEDGNRSQCTRHRCPPAHR